MNKQITKKYELFHPDHETRASMLLGIEKAINNENFADLFKEAGVLEMNPDDWAPAQKLLDILNELDSRGGAMLDFVAIGMQTMSDVEYPPEVLELPLEQKLLTAVSGYTQNNRGTDIGYIKSTKVALGHITYHIRTPLPDNLLYGIMYHYANRFIPQGIPLKVFYDEKKKRREQGGEETLVHVMWGNALKK